MCSESKGGIHMTNKIKKEIIKMINEIESEQILKIIYRFVKGMMD